MKLNKFFSAFVLIAAVAFAACEGPDINMGGPGEKPEEQDTTKVEGTAPDTIGWNIPAECLTVAQAREICAKLESGATTGTKYYVKGWVKKLASKHEEGVTQYNNAVFYIEDVKGANSQEDFEAFQVFGPNGSKITSLDQVVVGDYVVLYGELTNYSGTYETVGKGAAYIWKSTNPLLTGSSSTPTTPENEELIIPEEAKAWNIPAEAIDVLKAREICQGLESGAKTETKYYVMGYVKKLHNNHASGVSGYGNATFYMENTKGNNSDNDFLAYQVYGLDGKKINNPDAVAVGDFVVIYGELTNYMGNTFETVGKGAAYIWKSTNPLLAESSTGETGGGNTGSGDTGNTGNGGTSTDSDIEIPTDALVFSAGADQGNATTDYNQAGPYEVTKDGITIAVTKGCIGTYNNVNHYRIYKNEKLTITSTEGNIKEVVFTCTGNVGDEKYGPDCFSVDGGDYVYSGANGQWKGNASTVVFTASKNQLRATQIAVVLESETNE